MVVLDLDPASGVSGDSSFNWDGLWTGLRVCGLISAGTSHAFAFCHDSDGCNRLYQIDPGPGNKAVNDYVEGEEKRIKSFYIPKKYDWSMNRFDNKKLVGGESLVSGLTNRVSFRVDFRPDKCEVWIPFTNEIQLGPSYEPEYKFTHPLYTKVRFTTPDNDCILNRPANHARQFQFLIAMEGSMEVDATRFAAAKSKDSNSLSGDCDDQDESLSIEGTVEDDFEYNILD